MKGRAPVRAAREGRSPSVDGRWLGAVDGDGGEASRYGTVPRMGDPYRGSESPYSRQQLRGSRHVRVSRDLYVPRPDGQPPKSLADLSLGQRIEAGELLVPDLVLCGPTAAAWLRLSGVDDDEKLHVVRPEGSTNSQREGLVVRRMPVRADEVFLARGVRTMTGPRLLADLADTATFEQLVAIGDQVLRRWTREEVQEAVRRAAGRRGVVLLREAVPAMDEGSDSPAETRARLRLHAAGFVGMRHGVVVSDEAGGWLAQPDLADPQARVALQHEGAVHFALGEKQRVHDVHRDTLTVLAGWELVVSTRRDDADPDLLIAKVAHAYRKAALLRGTQMPPPL